MQPSVERGVILAELALGGVLVTTLYFIALKVQRAEIYWGFSSYSLLALPGLALTGLGLVGFVLGLPPRFAHGLAIGVGLACAYGAAALDSCGVLTGYNRWLRAGMPLAPHCEQCMDSFSRAWCHSLGNSRQP